MYLLVPRGAKVPEPLSRLFSRWYPALLALFFAAFIVYGSTLRHGFLEHDDDQHISRNPRMQTITAEGIAAFWGGSYLGLFIPVTYSYWTGAVALSHLGQSDQEVPYVRPWIFHLGNILLHALNAYLVYVLLRRFGAEAFAALVAAMVFLLHPIQVEAVAWVSGAKDLLSTCLALGAMIFYSSSIGLARTAKQNRLAQCLNYLAASALFGLAILAKPSTVVLPLLFLAQEFYGARRLSMIALLRVVPHLLGVGALLYFTGASQVVEGPFVPVPLWLRPFVAGDSVIFYLRQLFWPFNFAVDYGRRPDLLLQDQVRLTLATLPYILGGALLWNYRQQRGKAWVAAYAIFVVSLLPTLGFLQFSYAFFSLVCDRYAYLAMLGAAVLAATVFQSRIHRAGVIAAAALITFLGVQSARLATTWASEETLFGHSIDVEPEGAVALVGLSNDRANKGFWADTIPFLERASKALPTWGRPYNNLGTTYLNLGNKAEAVVKYRMALQYFPNYPMAQSNLCAALAGLEQFDEAEVACRASMAMAPDFDMPLLNLGYIQMRRGRLAEGEQAFRAALALSPGSYKARRNLTIALKQAHRCAEAIVHFKLLNQDYPSDQPLAVDFASCLQELTRNDEAQAVLRAFAVNNQGKAGIETVRSSLDQLQHK